MLRVILNCSKRCSVVGLYQQQHVKPTCIGAFSGSRLSSNTRHTNTLHRRYTCLASHHRYLSACHHYRITRYFSDLLTEDNVSKEDSPQTLQEFNIDVLVSLLRQENAADICVIKVPEEIKYTDYFIVVTGSSSRHLRAMALYANKVYKYMKKDEDPYAKIEGKDAEDWMCIDFGRMVVHFMLPSARQLYELEKLWTLRSLDDQLCSIPPETLPEDYMYGAEVTK